MVLHIFLPGPLTSNRCKNRFTRELGRPYVHKRKLQLRRPSFREKVRKLCSAPAWCTCCLAAQVLLPCGGNLYSVLQFLCSSVQNKIYIYMCRCELSIPILLPPPQGLKLSTLEAFLQPKLFTTPQSFYTKKTLHQHTFTAETKGFYAKKTRNIFATSTLHLTFYSRNNTRNVQQAFSTRNVFTPQTLPHQKQRPFTPEAC